MTESPDPRRRFDRYALARAFDRAGSGYDAAAGLQARVRAELLQRLQFFRLQPQVVLDVGAGTARASVALKQHFPGALVIAADIALGMLRAAPRPWWPWRRYERIVADAYALPLQAQSVDLIFSNLMLQWCDRPDAVFGEFQRVLRPTGLVVFSTFGPDTLWELREAWASVDDGEHVSRFADMQELGDGLTQAGLMEPVMDVEQHKLDYADSRSLMRELQRIGAANAALGRRRGLTGRTRMQAVTAAYERRRTVSGLPATYEVIFGAAFCGVVGAGGGGEAATGEYAVPLARVGRRVARSDQ